MAKPIVKIVNAETGEEIVREMNDTEFAQYEIDSAEAAARLAESETKTIARQAVLNRLGLTEEEAALLLK